MRRDQGFRYRSAASNRIWLQRLSGGIAAGVAIVGIVAFIVILGPGATWMYGSGLHNLSPEQQATAIDNFRGRLINTGTVLLAAGVLFYTARNFRLSRESHVTDRYTKATEQLGSASLDVRLSAIYALERIMIDSPRDHPTIVEVLAAYVREHARLTDRAERREKHAAAALPGLPAPDTDVQAVLTVLGRRPADREERGRLNLQSTDLTGANLGSAVLIGVDLSWADLSGANLSGANLSGGILPGADLASAVMLGTDLSAANLTRVKLHNVLLTSANLRGADLAYTVITDAFLNNADLHGANLDNADLTGSDLRDADLTNADLVAAKVVRAKLEKTNLSHANLNDADLTGSALTDADLSHASLIEATLTGASFRGAKLIHVYLIGANHQDVDLSSADTTEAIWKPVEFQIHFRKT